MSREEKSRGDEFVDKIPTKIWLECESKVNPFIADEHFCFGYSHLELCRKARFSESFFLLLKGELPSQEEQMLFDFLLNMPMAIGPRHNASRAGMNAGVSGTKVQHLLPISLSVLSGEINGTQGVIEAFQFLERNYRTAPKSVLKSLIDKARIEEKECETLIRGFGSTYSSIEAYPRKLIDEIKSKCSSRCFQWAVDFADMLKPLEMDWLLVGAFAALAKEVGLNYKQTAGTFQIACSPLLLALSLEKTDEKLTSMPFIKDENYVIEY